MRGKRAEYGKEIIKALAHSLTMRYGKGWGEKQLRNYVHFTEVYPDEQRGCLKSKIEWPRFIFYWLYVLSKIGYLYHL